MIHIAAADLNNHRIPGGLDIDTVHQNPNLKCINVHCWVLSSDGDHVLMQRRSPKMYCNPDKYDISLAGHVDGDEEPIQTMLREAYEEDAINLDGKLITFAEPLYIEEQGRYSNGQTWLHNQFVHLYFAIVDKSLVNVNSADPDVGGFEWWSLETFALRATGPISKRLMPHPAGYYHLVIKNLYELRKSHAKISA
jgi:8-oxo-dGTP pyrophosphatase MutT (NUDIX family)